MTNKIAMIFPGQGSQTLNMLSDFITDFPEILDTFNQASQVLGYDLWQIIQTDADQLNQTAITQPALLTASIALWRLWQKYQAISPIVMAGHSLGEYSALVCANSISFKDAVRLVAKRGQLMQQAMPDGVGAMAAIIGLSDAEVESLCQKLCINNLWVAPANFNAPGQVVIAGHLAAVQQAMSQAKVEGAKLVKQLNVSVPSHSILMQTAAEQLQTAINDIEWQLPQIPIIQNLSAQNFISLEDIKSTLLKQLIAPVQWTRTIQKMVKDFAVTHIIECGPGLVLTGLNKRMVDIPILSIGNVKNFQEGLKLCSI